MKAFATYLLQNIATHPEDVRVEESAENDTILLTCSVHKDDIGKIIGKEGKTIHAIRQLLRVRAIRDNVRVHIQLMEP